MSENISKIRWGKCTWVLFHTIAEKVNASYYEKNRWVIFDMIRQICKFLPCPYCADHATQFLSNVKIESVSNKQQFRAMLFCFHNSVNKRIGKPEFKYNGLAIYKNYNMGIALHNFLIFYAKRYNGTLQSGVTSTEMTRRKIAHSVTNWFRNNWANF